DRVCVRVGANVFVHTVRDRFVTSEHGADFNVALRLVRHQKAGVVDLSLKNRFEGRGSHFRQMVRTNSTAALYQRQDGLFIARSIAAPAPLADVSICRLAADISFISFNLMPSPPSWPLSVGFID